MGQAGPAWRRQFAGPSWPASRRHLARTRIAGRPHVLNTLVDINVAGALLVHAAAEHASRVAHFDVANRARPRHLALACTIPANSVAAAQDARRPEPGLGSAAAGRRGGGPHSHLQPSMHSGGMAAATAQSAKMHPNLAGPSHCILATGPLGFAGARSGFSAASLHFTRPGRALARAHG